MRIFVTEHGSRLVVEDGGGGMQRMMMIKVGMVTAIISMLVVVVIRGRLRGIIVIKGTIDLVLIVIMVMQLWIIR